MSVYINISLVLTATAYHHSTHTNIAFIINQNIIILFNWVTSVIEVADV